jgi:DNA segregation ATPase FtsK/SpoIIIE-like protein
LSEITPINHRREVSGVVYFAFAVIFGISYYLPSAMTGILGEMLRSIGKGLLGTAAYAIPVLLIYASIDYFLEKRKDVAPIRVKSVLLMLVCASSIMAVITVTPNIIRELSLDSLKNDARVTNAFSVLWKSGIDSSILQPESSDPILTGGVIGGSIALSLRLLAAKTGAMIILVAFTLSQLVLIFNVSLTKTASRTAEAIISSTQRASEAIRSGRDSRRLYMQQQASGRETDSFDTSYPVDTSPFDEIEIDEPQGFIDLQGTDAPMSASSYRCGDSSFDVDLSKPPIPESAKSLGGSMRQVEQKVNTDFIRNAAEPLPTATVPVPSDLPEFLRGKSEATWLDIKTTPYGSDSKVVEHIPIRRIDTNGDEYSPDSIVDGNPAVQKVISKQPPASGTQRSAVLQSTGSQVPPRANIPKPTYRAAPSALLHPDKNDDTGRSNKTTLAAQGKKLVDTLASFGVEATVVNVTHGPAITRFELSPGPGIKVSRIVNLTDDLALAMASVGVRIEAPIPGKAAIGIEIPNSETTPVTLRSLIDSPTFKKNTSPLTVALGRDIPGNPILCDLTTMPHLLIAGATGSGKSVCINSILISILCKATPDEVKLIMIDPKVVELSMYNGIPHLLAPVVTDPKKAANTLNWAVGEMTRRYSLFAEASVRDFRGYNEELKMNKEPPLPLILIVIDELADLMQIASKEVEESIARLTAMARAAGIHLLIATQRPSVDVITGVIKANIPSRIAFAVSSQVDSRTILDMGGAEKLLGRGDMLYYPQSMAKPQRGQGAFVSDGEVEAVIDFLKAQNLGTYDPETAEAIVSASLSHHGDFAANSNGEDELLFQAVDIVLTAGCASVSILQRRMNIGYPRAARLIDTMQDKGYIGAFEGSKPRKLLITQTQWLEIQARGG